MIINQDNIYKFPLDNRYDIWDINVNGFYKDDFTVMCRFAPDVKTLESETENNSLNTSGIFVLNGMHFGIFYNIHKDNGNYTHLIEFITWVYDKDSGLNKPLSKSIAVNPEERYYDVILKHYKNDKKFEFVVDGELMEIRYDIMVDYTHSQIWIGAANMELPVGEQCIFKGDIDKIHLQGSHTSTDEEFKFFDNYNEFISYIKGKIDKRNLFSTDFSIRTYYKLFDMSGNGQHPIKFYKPNLV